MSKSDKKIPDSKEIVDNIFEGWCLGGWWVDGDVLNHPDRIKYALTEAYMLGAVHGSLDSDILDKAVKYCPFKKPKQLKKEKK